MICAKACAGVRPRVWARAYSACQRRRKSSRCIWVAATHSKNGTSLSHNARISPKPHGSCVVNQGGGTSNPVRPGDTSRSAQPLGESHSTSPMAMAACGVASKAGRRDNQRPSCWRMKPLASTCATVIHANAVEASPVHSVMPQARQVCGSAHRACQAAASSICAPTANSAAPMGTAAINASSKAPSTFTEGMSHAVAAGPFFF